jgi:hypothetical protein
MVSSHMVGDYNPRQADKCLLAVLTKVFVYAGIPIMAIDPVRVVFVLLENLIGKPSSGL